MELHAIRWCNKTTGMNELDPNVHRAWQWNTISILPSCIALKHDRLFSVLRDRGYWRASWCYCYFSSSPFIGWRYLVLCMLNNVSMALISNYITHNHAVYDYLSMSNTSISGAPLFIYMNLDHCNICALCLTPTLDEFTKLLSSRAHIPTKTLRNILNYQIHCTQFTISLLQMARSDSNRELTFSLDMLMDAGYLTHLPQTKWPHHWHTTFSNAFSWTKIMESRFKFHWNLFPGTQLITPQHWFRQWLGAEQAPSHYLNQWWPSSLTHICGTSGEMG